MNLKFKILFFLLTVSILLFTGRVTAQVVVFQQGFDSTSGSQPNGTWTNVGQIQNGGNAWTNQGTGNDVIEGNNSCSGWSTCNDKTGHTYGITGGALNFKGTGTNVGYLGTNSSYFAIFNIYDASYGSYGGIYTPTFSLSGYTSANLTFYWNNANTTNSYIQVQYWNGSSWTGATNFGTGTGSLGWHQATMSLPSNATELVFFVVSDFYYYAVGLDQIEIYATPNCTTPSATISSSTNVNCHGQSTGSATVSTNGSSPTYSWAPSGGTNATASNLAAGTYTVTVTVPGGCHNTATVTIKQPATSLSASINSSVNVSPCSTSTNGTATASATGGTTPYTYSWSPSAGVTGSNTASGSTMSQGTYTCTVTDHNGCTATTTVTISGPSAVTGSVSSQTNVSCNGGNNGSATITAAGGTTPYTYSWAPSGGTNATA
ncbi:MAG TPA: SprB repeat-containing protein, partial [Bacteroidia bacterium]|nr:SprB repeat-containing protein [Bacteroidia bacterium]